MKAVGLWIMCGLVGEVLCAVPQSGRTADREGSFWWLVFNAAVNGMCGSGGSMVTGDGGFPRSLQSSPKVKRHETIRFQVEAKNALADSSESDHFSHPFSCFLAFLSLFINGNGSNGNGFASTAQHFLSPLPSATITRPNNLAVV